MSARRKNTGGRLKLRVRDLEDLDALGAYLQDALVPLADTRFLKAEKRFVLVANRFRWERAPTAAPAADSGPEVGPGSGPDGGELEDARFEDANGGASDLYERINCGLCFDHVRGVKTRGFDLGDRNQILNLLTLTGGPDEVTMIFSGGARIRLEVDRILCHVEDLGEPWPTRWRPAHDIDPPTAPRD